MKKKTKLISNNIGFIPTIILLIIFHFSFTINNCFSQWIQQYTGTTANLYSIKFINENTGWTCGAGTILKTTNGGNNWIFVNHPVTNKPLTKIFPLDSNIIYCCGMFRTLIKTTNGGDNWIILQNGPSGTGFSFFSMFFLNTNTGWIGGQGIDEILLKTTNGGVSFDSIYYGQGRLQDFYFRNENEGLYCGAVGAFKKTTDGGYNWFSVNIPVGSYLYNFRNFSFIDYYTGWTVTYSRKVFKTTDFGDNWDSISHIPESPPNGNTLHHIFFSSLYTGWCVGSQDLILITTNSGYNWTKQTGNIGGISLYFCNDSIGWKIGNLGIIHYTTNGGNQPSIVINNNSLLQNFILHQNYPNPFNSGTIITYDLRRNVDVKLNVYDILGKKTTTLVNEKQCAGTYKVDFVADELSSGVYFYQLTTNEYSDVKKMILIK